MNRSMIHAVRLLLPAALACCLASCSTVTMQQPFSDVETSTADPRLLGTWRPVSDPLDANDPQPAAGDETELLVIRRKAGTRNVVEFVAGWNGGQPDAIPVYVRPGMPDPSGLGSRQDPGPASSRSLEDENHPETITAYVRAGGPDLMSLVAAEDNGAVSYLPLKYDFPDERTLRLFPFDPGAFRDAVRRGELAGTIDEQQVEGGGNTVPEDERSVTLSSPPADVLRFIERYGEASFGKPIVLKKVLE